MNQATEIVLESLRSNYEGHSNPPADIDGWADVYLDNAKPAWMSPATFRFHLSALSKRGLYRPIDNYAWGKVKL